jgi:hypothetical protein
LPARVSLRAFGRDRHVSLAAVQKALRSGRLSKSVGRDARGPFIRDLALARREWAAGAAKPANGGNGGGRKRVHRATRAASPPSPPVVANGEPAPPATPAPSVEPQVGTLVHAQLRVADQRAVALELANKRRSGELVERATVQREQFEIARMLRERILNVADRLADLGPAVRTRVRAELRQALGDLADELERG